MNEISLGPCCVCGESKTTVRNIVMFDLKGPVPGTGWGCFQCGLPSDGAMAVLCDDCLGGKVPVKFAVKGYAISGERVPIETLTEEFKHNMRLHPEMHVLN